MAPLQKRALYSLVIGVILTIALIAVLIIRGDITTFDKDLGFRLIVYALWIGVPLASLIANLGLRKPGKVDERDKIIIDRSRKVQWIAVVLSLLVWTIVLTEVYWDRGQMPLIFLTLIIIFTLIISTLAESFGILIGYWRMERRD